MAIDTKHPLYSEFIGDWQMMRDTYRGERRVKDNGRVYLPPTSGMLLDGMEPAQPGWNAYQAYLRRAVFHDFVADAVEGAIGLMHHKAPIIELPPQLEPLREVATVTGETLEQLLRRINEQQLVFGRCGLLLDLPVEPDPANPLPYIAMYQAENIINWDDGARGIMTLPQLNLVVLNESEFERQMDFTWEFIEKYRLLILGDPQLNETVGVYRSALVRQTGQSAATEAAALNALNWTEPSVRGRTLDEIPFVFVNSKDIVTSPDDPPLLGLARLALTIFRGEADYRQNLFMQGQDTLVVIGAQDTDFRVGAGASIVLPQGGDAKYVGVTSSGLPEQRQALENDKMMAANRAGQLIDTRTSQRESGEALKTRVAAQTATLNQLAITGAAGLEQILRIAATWVGANPDAVSVTPNLEFADDKIDGQTLVQYMTARTMGAPLSLRSIHGLMKEQKLTDMTFEEEVAEIESEAPRGEGTMEGGNPEDDDEQREPPSEAGVA